MKKLMVNIKHRPREHQTCREQIPTKLTAAMVAFIGQMQSAVAADVSRAFVCEDEELSVGEGKKPTILKYICGEEFVEEDPEMHLRLLESFRSSGAFQDAASKLPEFLDLSKRKLTILYPAAGSHLAPILMPIKLMNDGKIDEAELIYTEVDECTFQALQANLEMLARKFRNFSFDPEKNRVLEYVSVEDPTSVGSSTKVIGHEYGLMLQYRGKPIRIRFMLNCSGDNWFRSESLPDTDVFISHDGAGPTSKGTLFMILQYFRAKASEEISKRQALMVENVTNEYGQRKFDLELLGAFRVVQRSYGCHDGSRERFEKKSPLIFCEMRRRKKEEPYSYDYTLEQVDALEKGEVIPYESYTYADVLAEVGSPRFSSGALLQIYPELFKLDYAEVETLIDLVSLAKEGPYTDGRIQTDRERIGDIDKGLFANGTRTLATAAFLKEMVEATPKLLQTMQEIHPLLAQGLAARVVQAFTYLLGKTRYYDGKVEWKDLKTFLRNVEKYLPKGGKDDKKMRAALVKIYLTVDRLERTQKHSSRDRFGNVAIDSEFALRPQRQFFDTFGDEIFQIYRALQRAHGE